MDNAPNDSRIDNEMEPIRKISEKNTEESMPSEISHYIEDEMGNVTRVMIKNVNKGLKDEFFESRTNEFNKKNTMTPKSKLLQDHVKLLDDMLKSD